MEQLSIPPQRKKKIKKVLSLMNKQNQRLIPVTNPIVEMMDLTTTDEELDYLLAMGTEFFDYEQAGGIGHVPKEKFSSFFDTIKRKGLVHVDQDQTGKEIYRLNAIAVGWYECMMHYLVGKPQEKAFSEKFEAYFKNFQKFNFYPLRNVQNLFMRSLLKPSQDTAIMDSKIEKGAKGKTIPINTPVAVSDSRVYPTFLVNELIEDYGHKDAIYAFPCVCRHGNTLLESPCRFKMPKESCIAFGAPAKVWAGFGYGRHISKNEAIDILKEVGNKGAVHSVIHERDDYRLPVAAICNCCWDCCGILKPYNMGATALLYKASYTARIRNEADCKGCATCSKYCPTTAIKLVNKKAELNDNICIGCGQCAFQCTQNNIELYPNERMVYLPILKKSEAREYRA
jgi:Pyruvate/2-oxoacid:ferredoxin oxidoreductase delta subunit